MDSLVDGNDGNPLQHSVLPFVEVDWSKIYKSTLVSELNDKLTLFKVKPTKMKYDMLYVKPKVQLCRVGDNDYILKLGHDCAYHLSLKQ